MTDPIEVNPRPTYDSKPKPNQALGNKNSTDSLGNRVSKPVTATKKEMDVKATTDLLNFDGIPFQGIFPPDTVGDIGLDYYIQMTNGESSSSTQIFNKADGTTAVGPFLVQDLADPTLGCSNGRGDPIVLYDQFADRWLLSEIASGINALCVYISKTSDPINGGWWSYQFVTPNFPDYPKYGVSEDSYFVGTNEATPAIYALERNQMLNGGDAKWFRNTVSLLNGFGGFQITLPVDADGETPPPMASPGIFVRHNDDEAHSATPDDTQNFLEIFEYTVNYGALSDTVVGPIQIGVNEFSSDLCGFLILSCIPQPGTLQRIDPLREPISTVPSTVTLVLMK